MSTIANSPYSRLDDWDELKESTRHEYVRSKFVEDAVKCQLPEGTKVHWNCRDEVREQSRRAHQLDAFTGVWYAINTDETPVSVRVRGHAPRIELEQQTLVGYRLLYTLAGEIYNQNAVFSIDIENIPKNTSR